MLKEGDTDPADNAATPARAASSDLYLLRARYKAARDSHDEIATRNLRKALSGQRLTDSDVGLETQALDYREQTRRAFLNALAQSLPS